MANVYKTAIDALAMYAETDCHGTISYVNDQFCNVTGYSRSELEGHNVREVLNFAQSRPRRTVGNITESKQNNWKGDLRNRRKDGTGYWVECTVISNTDDNDNVTYAVICFDTTRQRRAMQSLQWHAFHDSLTGLPNRALLRDRLETSLAFAAQHSRALAIGVIDLDGFKHINDTYGHAVGDSLLDSVGKRLTSSLREEDVVARLGGDEFVVVLNDISVLALPSELKRLVKALHQPYWVDGWRLDVGGSVGIAVYPDNGQTSSTLLQHADRAMYEAKRYRRGRFHIFDSPAIKDPDNESQNRKCEGLFDQHVRPSRTNGQRKRVAKPPTST